MTSCHGNCNQGRTCTCADPTKPNRLGIWAELCELNPMLRVRIAEVAVVMTVLVALAAVLGLLA